MSDIKKEIESIQSAAGKQCARLRVLALLKRWAEKPDNLNSLGTTPGIGLDLSCAISEWLQVEDMED